jgi:short-subunit dehydrogenase
MPIKLTRSSSRVGSVYAGQRILICGASGNLGGHLARQLSRDGVRLLLWGRDERKLSSIAAECRRSGTLVETRTVDLSDAQAAVAALIEDDELDAIDSAFFVAGVGDTREPGRIVESPSQLIRLGNVNFIAPAALSAALGERMANRGKGRIVVTGTAAATHPLPFAAGYASSKCGLAHFAEAIRIALEPHGVSVTLISPGFFAAPADEEGYSYARPGEISADLVARRTITAASRGKAELVTPAYFQALRWVGNVLPRVLRDRLMRALPSP